MSNVERVQRWGDEAQVGWDGGDAMITDGNFHQHKRGGEPPGYGMFQVSSVLFVSVTEYVLTIIFDGHVICPLDPIGVSLRLRRY